MRCLPVCMFRVLGIHLAKRFSFPLNPPMVYCPCRPSVGRMVAPQGRTPGSYLVAVHHLRLDETVVARAVGARTAQVLVQTPVHLVRPAPRVLQGRPRAQLLVVTAARTLIVSDDLFLSLDSRNARQGLSSGLCAAGMPDSFRKKSSDLRQKRYSGSAQRRSEKPNEAGLYCLSEFVTVFLRNVYIIT